MSQEKRSSFAHWFNTTPTAQTKNWEIEGIGVDSFSLQYNPQVTQYKTILDETADAEFEGYQIQSSVSGKRIEKTDPIYNFLKEARLNSKEIVTQCLEVDMTEQTDGAYTALEYNVLIVMNEILGEKATISYDLYVKKSPTRGTATITEGKPVFTPLSVASL